MATIITDILTAAQLTELQTALGSATWQDGKASAGPQSASVKANHQLAADDPLALRAGQALVAALMRHAGFFAAALPNKFSPVLFSRYGEGEQYGLHIDNAVRAADGGQMRTDLAATLFLGPPDSYDGGELLIDTGFGTSSIKLPAGQMILYPATTLHRVAPVTRGVRLAAVFWVQSMVRNEADRALLLDMDRAIQTLGARVGRGDAQILALTRSYHNLLRRWAEL
ncbi:MAG: Fe2+-dependent dioxygenase [Polymorphobacter sp.]|uniref:Fe2+-dependent dioxygenase n=1 Tax=Polymorphobacter sp. TaxID=1909290 RepID=UPI003A878362